MIYPWPLQAFCVPFYISGDLVILFFRNIALLDLFNTPVLLPRCFVPSHALFLPTTQGFALTLGVNPEHNFVLPVIVVGDIAPRDLCVNLLYCSVQ